MNVPQNWSKLSTKQVNLLLIKILWNLNKSHITEEPDSVFHKGKYCINDTVTIEEEYEQFFHTYIDFPINEGCNEVTLETPDQRIGYSTIGYKINGKFLPKSTMLASMLYERCAKRVK